MKKPIYCMSSILILMSLGTLANAESFTVAQKDKKFSQATIKIKSGDSINFRNEDPWFHNIFSLSDIQSFDLGSYPKGQFKTVVFNKEGKIDVECAIHPEMHMVVEVVK